MPDGEKQNRCPRTYLKEHAEDWSYIIGAYNAYEKGFLPTAGGMDAQPALFLPTMIVIHSAIQDEQEYQKALAEKRKALVEQTNARSQAKNSGYSKLHVPGKRR